MANRIARELDVVGVFSEAKHPKRYLAEMVSSQAIEGHEEIAEYLAGFIEAEKKYLCPEGEEFRLTDDVPFISVVPDTFNDEELIQQIKDLKPDCFAVFGTSLIKKELLDLTPNFINIHLGLSPWYRGMAGSFWPFYNDELAYIGVTVFFLDPGIDSGPIIHQDLVTLEKGDTIHDASVKAIISGVDLQLQALREMQEGTIKSYPQDLSLGQVFYNKDFNVEVLREFRQRWPQDRIDAYVDEQDLHKAKVQYIS